MWELAIIVGLVAALFVVATVPWSSLFVAGLVTTGVGLVFGVLTGFWYHVALGRALAAADALPPRWWLRPVPLHERLQPASRRRVMPWFYAGGAGFVLTVIGIGMLAVSIAVGFWREG